MLSATSLYFESIKHSHRAAIRAKLYEGPSTYIGLLQVVEGEFTFDSDAQHRRYTRFTVARDPEDTTSRDVLEQLSTTAGEVSLEAGVAHTDGTVEWVQFARLRITEYTLATDSATAEIVAYDKTVMLDGGILDHVTLQELVLQSNIDWKTAVSRIVADSVPGVSPSGIAYYPGLPSFLIEDEDRVGLERTSAIRGWLDKAEAELICDHEGFFILRLDDTAPGPWVWEVAGGAGNTLVKVVERWTREEMYNGVFLTWTDPDNAKTFYALSVDNDANSPTYWLGDFGKKTKTVDDVPVSSAAQAGQVATKILGEYKDKVSQLEITCIRNPLLEVKDALRVRIPRTGELGYYQIVSFNFNFAEPTMTITAKEIR